jgi:hypothetical protein
MISFVRSLPRTPTMSLFAGSDSGRMLVVGVFYSTLFSWIRPFSHNAAAIHLFALLGRFLRSSGGRVIRNVAEAAKHERDGCISHIPICQAQKKKPGTKRRLPVLGGVGGVLRREAIQYESSLMSCSPTECSPVTGLHLARIGHSHHFSHSINPRKCLL